MAATTLPATRFRPDLTPTATKLYATLLRADQPLGRSELIESAGISASSYDRRLSDVRDLDRVSTVHLDGYRQWIVDDASTQATVWEPPVVVSSKRGDTTTPLVTPQQPTTPNQDSVQTTVRGGCSHGDTATATALDGKTVHQTVRLIEPDSERIVWSTHIPVPSRT